MKGTLNEKKRLKKEKKEEKRTSPPQGYHHSETYHHQKEYCFSCTCCCSKSKDKIVFQRSNQCQNAGYIYYFDSQRKRFRIKKKESI
jgi:hypothetical protein